MIAKSVWDIIKYSLQQAFPTNLEIYKQLLTIEEACYKHQAHGKLVVQV